jgi:hypothetical protein
MLVDLSHAKRHLAITSDSGDTLIVSKALEASDIILDYLDEDGDLEWTSDTVPPLVRSAVLLMLTHLWEHRGDEMEPDAMVWQAVGRVLARTRTPVVA